MKVRSSPLLRRDGGVALMVVNAAVGEKLAMSNLDQYSMLPMTSKKNENGKANDDEEGNGRETTSGSGRVNEGDEQRNDDEPLRCGWLLWRPDCIQMHKMARSMKYMLAVMTIFSFLNGALSCDPGPGLFYNRITHECVNCTLCTSPALCQDCNIPSTPDINVTESTPRSYTTVEAHGSNTTMMTDTPPSASTREQLTVGAIVGIVMAGIVATAAVITVIFIMIRRCRRLNKSADQNHVRAVYQSDNQDNEETEIVVLTT